MCIKKYNKLPPFIQNTPDNSKTFKNLFKKFLYANSFCTMDEYFNYSSTQILVKFTCTVAITKIESTNIHILYLQFKMIFT